MMQRTLPSRAASYVWLAALALMLVEPIAHAQATDDEDDLDVPARLVGNSREEITVPARRREESLQDVPISVTAFDSDTLRDKNIINAYDIAANTPNFSFTPNLGRRLDVPNIRGQFGPLVGGTAPNAGFFVDGVYVASSIGSTSTANLERVEILRGPQSALFGRATFSGAVNYITRRPTEEFEGQVNALVGQDQRRQLGIWGSGPIIEDKLYFFAGLDYNAWEGEWTNNLQPGQVNSVTQAGPFGRFIWRNNPQLAGDPPCPPGSLPPVGGTVPGCAPTVGDNTKLGGEETRTGTVKLLFTPTDDLDVVFKYENSQADDDHFVYNFVPPGENNNCFNLDSAGNALDPR
ncbi:MAG: TonB-dependent receptor plug domain-containing protein, partial [Gammaproteobacteria bacterium]|nr:TonB-dependent receptor plug domain-containing protein [Gammaproteobacteria bacterium]